jgi:hypothetical protein
MVFHICHVGSHFGNRQRARERERERGVTTKNLSIVTIKIRCKKSVSRRYCFVGKCYQRRHFPLLIALHVINKKALREEICCC